MGCRGREEQHFFPVLSKDTFGGWRRLTKSDREAEPAPKSGAGGRDQARLAVPWKSIAFSFSVMA